jgi:hypothetical protein
MWNRSTSLWINSIEISNSPVTSLNIALQDTLSDMLNYSLNISYIAKNNLWTFFKIGKAVFESILLATNIGIYLWVRDDDSIQVLCHMYDGATTDYQCRYTYNIYYILLCTVWYEKIYFTTQSYIISNRLYLSKYIYV